MYTVYPATSTKHMYVFSSLLDAAAFARYASQQTMTDFVIRSQKGTEKVITA